MRGIRSVLLVACCFSIAFLTPNVAGAAQASERAVITERLGNLSKPERVAFEQWINHKLFEEWLAAYSAYEESERVACGGSLPDCYIAQRESKFNPCAVNPGHQGALACTGTVDDPGDPETHASGKWQFEPGTWNDYDGYLYAAAAPASVQNDKAREVWAGGAGASNWACC